MIFTLHGPIVPYTRMTQRSKWTDRAKRYHASQQAIGLQLQQQMAAEGYEMLPDQTPLSIDLYIYRPRALHRGDLSNIVKAVEDAAQGIVFKNDCWVDSINASRHIGDDYYCTLRVYPLGGKGK